MLRERLGGCLAPSLLSLSRAFPLQDGLVDDGKAGARGSLVRHESPNSVRRLEKDGKRGGSKWKGAGVFGVQGLSTAADAWDRTMCSSKWT